MGKNSTPVVTVFIELKDIRQDKFFIKHQISKELNLIMNKILGLHHITAIAGDAQRNYDFYTNRSGFAWSRKPSISTIPRRTISILEMK